MSSSNKNILLETLIAISSLTAASAFGYGIARRAKSAAPFQVTAGPALVPRNAGQSQASFSLSAVIYGWDGEEEEDIVATDIFNDYDEKTCAGTAQSPVAAAVAESITHNQEKTGSLARLAVAFSPPERALQLKDIEKVEVICVSETHIEIEAVICEDGGCVSLNVPVSFPNECGSEWLEGCVMRNLDELDFEAESLIRVMEEETEHRDDADQELDDLCIINSKSEFPSWWVPPECDAALVAESDTIRRLLNDDEFQNDVRALAQRGAGDGYDVKRAVVAAVGPAGICLKVRAAFQHEPHKPIHILDVLVPFGGEPKQDAESMRAAVLGAVMASND